MYWQGAINRVVMRRNNLHECASASSDGTCIVWDLTTFKRKCTLSAATFFKDIAYSIDDSQFITAGMKSSVHVQSCHFSKKLDGSSRAKPEIMP
jgi:WD40 repeat protein